MKSRSEIDTKNLFREFLNKIALTLYREVPHTNKLGIARFEFYYDFRYMQFGVKAFDIQEYEDLPVVMDEESRAILVEAYKAAEKACERLNKEEIS